MTTWIFRFSPQELDLDNLLKESPAAVGCTLPRNRTEMRVGDQIFLWRGKAGKASDAELNGIVAEAFITSMHAPKTARSEIEGSSIMVQPGMRVELRVARIELKKRLKGEWFSADPVISQSIIVKTDRGNDFLLTDDQAARINALWRRAQTDWTYAENVAGIWAFRHTLGTQISRLPGSPVAMAALRTGRLVQGMYNRVQHFRALDPNDTRVGLPSISHMERRVWNDFFDFAQNRLREDDIEAEFARLWPDEEPEPLPPHPDPEIAAAALAKLPIEQLLARYARRSTDRPSHPRTYRSTTTAFERDPLVVA